MGLLDIFEGKKVSFLAEQIKLLSNENSQLMQVASKYNEVFYQYLNGQSIYQKDNPQSYIELGYEQNEDVYSITSAIAQKCAQGQRILYEVKDENALKRYKSLKNGNTAEAKFEALKYQVKALKEVEKHPILTLLDNPNPDESGFEFDMKSYLFLLLCGNQFFYGIDGLKKGIKNQIYSLPAHLTYIVGGDKFNPVNGYQCFWGRTELNFGKDEVKHVKYPGFNYNRQGGHLYGQSPLKVAIRNTISRMIANNEQMLRQTKNAGAMGFVSNDSDKMPMSPEQATALENKIKDKLKSRDEFDRIKVSNGSLKWSQIGFSTIELDLLNIANFDAKKICNLYGYPVQLYNSEAASTDNNMKWAAKNFINNTIAPLHTQMDDALNKFVVEPYSKADGKKYYLEHDILSYPEMQEDMVQITTWLEKSWDLTPNEKREIKRFGKLADPNMDKIYIPSNLVPIESVNLTADNFNINE